MSLLISLKDFQLNHWECIKKTFYCGTLGLAMISCRVCQYCQLHPSPIFVSKASITIKHLHPSLIFENETRVTIKRLHPNPIFVSKASITIKHLHPSSTFE
jgi:hypothetical protein